MPLVSETQRYQVHFNNALPLVSALQRDLDETFRGKGTGSYGTRVLRMPNGVEISINDVPAGKKPKHSNCGVDVLLSFPAAGILDCTLKYSAFRRRAMSPEAKKIATDAAVLLSTGALGLVTGQTRGAVALYKVGKIVAGSIPEADVAEGRQAALYAEVRKALVRSLKSCDPQCAKVAPSQQTRSPMVNVTNPMADSPHRVNSSVTETGVKGGLVVSYCACCGAEFHKDAAFCPSCGKPVVTRNPWGVCPHCGASLRNVSGFWSQLRRVRHVGRFARFAAIER